MLKILKSNLYIDDKKISIIASITVALIILEPAFMAIYDMIKLNIDYAVLMSLNVVRNYLFPIIRIITFVIYILVLLNIKKENLSIFKAIKKNPIFVIFSLFVIIMFISQLYNGMLADYGAVYDLLAGESFDMQYSYFIFIIFAATQVRVDTHKHNLLRIHLLVSIVLVVTAFVLWHTQTDSELFSDWTERFSSIFSNVNYYGYYLALSVPLSAACFLVEQKLLWKIVAFISLVMNSIALSIDDSLGAWIGAAAAMIFVVITFSIIKGRIEWQPFVLLLVFIICIFTPGHIMGTFEETVGIFAEDVGNIVLGDEKAAIAGSGRWQEWKEAIYFIGENKIFGVGFEGIYAKWIEYVHNTRPHNEFLQYALFYGIPAGILYFVGCLSIYIRALKKKKNMTNVTWVCLAGAFGYLVSSLVGITVYSVTMYLFVFLGMGYVRNSEG